MMRIVGIQPTRGLLLKGSEWSGRGGKQNASRIDKEVEEQLWEGRWVVLGGFFGPGRTGRTKAAEILPPKISRKGKFFEPTNKTEERKTHRSNRDTQGEKSSCLYNERDTRRSA